MIDTHARRLLDRPGFADLLANRLTAAANPLDPDSDTVNLAAARRLGRSIEQTSSTAQPIADWSRPASVLAIEEFLAPGEMSALRDFVLARQRDFKAGTLVSGDQSEVYVDRSVRVVDYLSDLGPFRKLFEDRIDRYLPFVYARLGLPPVERHWFEFQMTAIPNGGFFRRHDDNSHPVNRTRLLTLVFYFFCSPSPPRGGELRFSPPGEWSGPVEFQPLANRMLFFDSSIPHEVVPVRSPSDRFEAARFTVNGWVHQDRR